MAGGRCAGSDSASYASVMVQSAPEAFHGRVAVAVARSAHAGDHAGLHQARPVMLFRMSGAHSRVVTRRVGGSDFPPATPPRCRPLVT